MPSNTIEKNKLERKFTQRIAWWSRKRWCDVIAIPSGSSSVSLLTCDISCLSNVKLFNLTLRQLEDKIQAYRKKPAWRRWLQRCFSSINQQIESQKYYHACLDVRGIKSSPEKKFSSALSTIAGQSSDVQPSVITFIPATTLSETEEKDEYQLSKFSKGIREWVKKSKKDIRSMLQEQGEEAVQDNELPSFFEKKKEEFTNDFIDPLLKLIGSAKNDENYKQELLKTISKVFKEALLFFHPDNNRDILNLYPNIELVFNNIYNIFDKYHVEIKNKLTNNYYYSESEIGNNYSLFKKLNQDLKEMEKDRQQQQEKSVEKENLFDKEMKDIAELQEKNQCLFQNLTIRK